MEEHFLWFVTKNLVSWGHFVISSDLSFSRDASWVDKKNAVYGISISCSRKDFLYKGLLSWWCAIGDCSLCCCSLIPRCLLKEPWHVSVSCHWKRVCGCRILFWNGQWCVRKTYNYYFIKRTYSLQTWG